MSTRNLKLKIEGDASGVKPASNTVQSEMRRLKREADRAALGLQKTKTSGVEMARGIGAAIASAGIFRAFGRMLSDMDDIAKGAKQVGMTTSEFQELKYAAEQSGAGMNVITRAMKTLQQYMGDTMPSATFLRALEQMGASVDDFRKMAPSEMFNEIADRIAAIEDPTERASVAIRMFGAKAGQALLPMLENLKALRHEAANIKFSEEALRSAEQFNDYMNQTKTGIMAFLGNAWNKTTDLGAAALMKGAGAVTLAGSAHANLTGDDKLAKDMARKRAAFWGDTQAPADKDQSAEDAAKAEEERLARLAIEREKWQQENRVMLDMGITFGDRGKQDLARTRRQFATAGEYVDQYLPSSLRRKDNGELNVDLADKVVKKQMSDREAIEETKKKTAEKAAEAEREQAQKQREYLQNMVDDRRNAADSYRAALKRWNTARQEAMYDANIAKWQTELDSHSQMLDATQKRVEAARREIQTAENESRSVLGMTGVDALKLGKMQSDPKARRDLRKKIEFENDLQEKLRDAAQGKRVHFSPREREAIKQRAKEELAARKKEMQAKAEQLGLKGNMADIQKGLAQAEKVKQNWQDGQIAAQQLRELQASKIKLDEIKTAIQQIGMRP